MRNIFNILIIVFFVLTFQNSISQVFWDEVNSGVTKSLNSISNIDRSNAWICGDSGTVIKTSNNGYNWVNLTGHGIPLNVKLICIWGISSSEALTAGFKDTTTFVYRTTNSGINWIQIFSQQNSSINAIWMKNDSVGFMEGNPVGGRWSLWKTTNRGANWDSIGLFLSRNGSETGWKNSMCLVNNKIWFGTNNSRIYYSDSSGYRWYIRPTAPEINIYSLLMDYSPSLIGYCGGTSLYRSTNGGTNWTLLTTPGSGNFTGIIGRYQMFDNLWCTRGNSICFSNSGSTNWYISYTAPSGSYNNIALTRSSTSYGSGFIYAVRDNGGITRGNMIIDAIRLISGITPSSFKLYQNYPNPFNSSTKIKFDSKVLNSSKRDEVRGGHIHLIIYDVQGREMESLENRVVQPGVYEATWNAGNLNSGIYFCRLLVSDPNGNETVFSEIIKLMLIK
jgi:photosystem II stability/assembly factor-like uncharacterized protein